MLIKIVRRPSGETPEWIRDAWIGLTLPILTSAPQKLPTTTLEAAAAGRMPSLSDVLSGRDNAKSGYVVPIRPAIKALAVTQPEAAAWWRANAGGLIKNRGALLFDADACEPLNRTNGGAAWIPERYKRFFPASPGRIASLWFCGSLICLTNAICFPSVGEAYRQPLELLYISGTPIFAGLLGAWIMRLKGSSLHLVSAFASLDLAVALIEFILKLICPPAYDATVDGVLALILPAGFVALVEIGFRGLRSPRRRAAATVAAILSLVGASELLDLTYSFWRLSSAVRPLIGRAPEEDPSDTAPNIDADVLWGAQAGLVGHQISALLPRDSTRTNIYAIAIAGSGTQSLFGREAHAAAEAVSSHFGDASRGAIILSNAVDDEMHLPLATRANIAASASAISSKMDRARDVLLIYLASHGSRTAELTSALPDYQSVQPISAISTAKALNDANVAKRIVVVSACYAATWIPALANDNTIVIAAAAKDRTSFGCDDSRHLTFFGEAFLSSLTSSSVSFRDAFEQAKRKIASEEGSAGFTPSNPQAFVGRNMQALWAEKPLR